MAQSLFKAIKQLNDEVAIDVLASDWSLPLLERMPEVRQTKRLPIAHGALQLKLRFKIAHGLRSQGYDQAIILPNSWKSALIPWWAKIPKRTGWCGEMRWGLLNDLRLLDKKTVPLMVDRFVSLAYPKEMQINSDRYKRMSPSLKIQEKNITLTLKKFGLSDKMKNRILALCPGAEFGASKRWPEEYYAELAKTKLREGWSVWLFGSKNDQMVSHKIQALTGDACIDLTGKTNLGEAIDLLSVTTTVVSNDSGLMHVASALDKPIIAIFGSTDPKFTPPLHQKVKISRLSSLACSPCFKRTCPLHHHACMRRLSPTIILQDFQCLEKQWIL